MGIRCAERNGETLICGNTCKEFCFLTKERRTPGSTNLFVNQARIDPRLEFPELYQSEESLPDPDEK